MTLLVTLLAAAAIMLIAVGLGFRLRAVSPLEEGPDGPAR